MEVWKAAARELCCMPVLLWLAIEDRKYLGIKKAGLCVAVVLLLTAGCFCKEDLFSRAGGAAFGIVLLAFSYFSREALGVADGIVIFACGIAFGLQEIVALCFLASLYAGVFSMVLLLTKKAERKSRIPFLPFLLLGYVTVRLIANSV